MDNVYLETLEIPENYKAFAVSYLTGQYDQRADSAAQCVQLLTRKSRPLIKCARVYMVKGVTDEQLSQIKKHIIEELKNGDIENFDDIDHNTIAMHLENVINEYQLSNGLIRDYKN